MRLRLETIREEDHKEIANVLLDLYTLLLEYNSDIDRELEKRGMHIVFVMKKFGRAHGVGVQPKILTK